MHVNWFAYIIVFLSFSSAFSCYHAKDGRKSNFCIEDKILVIQTVMSDAVNASISCPDLKPNMENAHIVLYKDAELHFTDFQKTQATSTTNENQRFNVHFMNDTVYYVIDRPQVSDTGLYNCTVAYSHKPTTTKTTYTYLHVKDPNVQPIMNEGHPVSMILLAVSCGLMSLYNLIFTIVCCFFQWKLWHQDTYYNDYYNIRPGEFSRVK